MGLNGIEWDLFLDENRLMLFIAVRLVWNSKRFIRSKERLIPHES